MHEDTGGIAPGVYWVMPSNEYRSRIDKRYAECGMVRMQWPERPFIAEWGNHTYNPTPEDWGWMTPGDELTNKAGDFTIISGPLEPSNVHD